MTMKYINKTLLACSLLAMTISCTNVDDEIDYSSVNKPVVSANSTNITVNEGDDIVLSLTADQTSNTDMDYKIEIVAGDNFDVFDFVYNASDPANPPVLGKILETGINPDASGIDGYRFFFPAYQTDFDITIGTAVLDYIPEGVETFQIKLISLGNKQGLVDSSSEIINVTINDVNSFMPYAASDVLEIALNWTNLPYYTTGDADFDLEVYDGAFGYYDASYSSHPEMITFDSSTPDDTYYIAVEFWSVNGVDSEGEVPINLSFTKPGSYSETYDIKDKFFFEVGGCADYGIFDPFAYEDFYMIFVVEKVGNVYTVYDQDDVEIVSGRYANIGSMLKNKLGRKSRRVN